MNVNFPVPSMFGSITIEIQIHGITREPTSPKDHIALDQLIHSAAATAGWLHVLCRSEAQKESIGDALTVGSFNDEIDTYDMIIRIKFTAELAMRLDDQWLCDRLEEATSLCLQFAKQYWTRTPCASELGTLLQLRALSTSHVEYAANGQHPPYGSNILP